MQTHHITNKSPDIFFQHITKGDDNEYHFLVESGIGKTLLLLLHGDISAKVTISLLGEDTNLTIRGIVLADREQKINLQTFQHHKALRTTSDLLVKAALFDSASFSYHGMIRVEKEAQHTNAYQRNDNLLMSESVHAKTDPALEILANDVRCTHGATTGFIDSEQLFYLHSRGIKNEQAQRLLVEGFLNAVLGNMEEKYTKEVQCIITQFLTKKFN